MPESKSVLKRKEIQTGERPSGHFDRVVMKPCPFCGNTNISEGESLSEKDGRYHKQTGCTECGALGPVSVCDDIYDDSKANAAWNRRAL